MSHPDEQWAADNFSERYRTPVSRGVLAEIEERVIGGAWSANGYTTRARADELGERLNLGAESDQTTPARGLVRSAGFTDVEAFDRTTEYRETLRAWHDRYQEREHEVVSTIGRQLFDERRRDRLAAIAAIEAGQQRRVLIVGVNGGLAARTR
jgi:hypothetical protein